MVFKLILKKEVDIKIKASFFDLSLANKIGQVLEILYNDKCIDKYEIINRFIISDTFTNIIDWDISLVSQSRYYIADVLTDEFKDINKTIEPIEDNTDYFSDIRKHFYKSILELRYNKILIPTLEKIFQEDNTKTLSDDEITSNNINLYEIYKKI